MRELRIVTCLALGSALLGFGCDDSSPTDAGTPDTGVVLMDSGPRSDSGPLPDSGPSPDSGPTGTCGPAAGDCDISVPTSCGTGMACILNGSTADGWTSVCITAGVIAAGGTCMPGMDAQCQEGYECFSEPAVCSKLCCGNTDCSPGEFCSLIGGADAGFCRLSDSCDLVAQTGCGTGLACYPAGGGNVTCGAPGTTAADAACMYANECIPGYGCLGTTATDGACHEFCDPAASACPTGSSCRGITGFDGVGACFVDPPP